MTKQIRNFKYRNKLIREATRTELSFKKRLDKLKIRYLFQKGFIKGDYHCIVDFYLPKPHKICIELDGGYHNSSKQIARDNEKEAYLISRGFKLLRIKNEDIELFDFSVFSL